jgi:hypothetical protein
MMHAIKISSFRTKIRRVTTDLKQQHVIMSSKIMTVNLVVIMNNEYLILLSIDTLYIYIYILNNFYK